MQWDYEPDENPKRKHAWNRNKAGFIEIQGVLVGKCPCKFSLQTASVLLNQGIEYKPTGWAHDHPSRIYVLHEGTLYRAVPTNPGRSYHGFPELPSEFDNLPKSLRKRIWQRAQEIGCEEEFKRWLRS